MIPFFHTRSGIRSAGILLPLLGITWVFGLLAVNQTLIIYQYLFAIFNSITGLAILLFHCGLDYRVIYFHFYFFSDQHIYVSYFETADEFGTVDLQNLFRLEN